MLKSRAVNFCFLFVILAVVIADVLGDVSVWSYVIPVLLYVALQVYGSVYLAAGFFLPVRFAGPPTEKVVALSFDDGPLPARTEKILDILKSREVRAAFFCIGHRVKAHPEIVKRIDHEGHLVGNHSYWHGKMFDLQLPGKIADELQQTDIAIQECIGHKPKFFRPPYGVTNPLVASAVNAGHHVTVGWSVRSFDTVIKDKSGLLKRLTSKTKPGDIILFHDYSDTMLEILPAFLDHLAKVGLKIVRLDELLNEKAYV